MRFSLFLRSALPTLRRRINLELMGKSSQCGKTHKKIFNFLPRFSGKAKRDLMLLLLFSFISVVWKLKMVSDSVDSTFDNFNQTILETADAELRRTRKKKVEFSVHHTESTQFSHYYRFHRIPQSSISDSDILSPPFVNVSHFFAFSAILQFDFSRFSHSLCSNSRGGKKSEKWKNYNWRRRKISENIFSIFTSLFSSLISSIVLFVIVVLMKIDVTVKSTIIVKNENECTITNCWIDLKPDRALKIM